MNLQAITHWFGIEKEQTHKSKVTNKQILNELEKHFKLYIKDNSLEKTIIFPMTFTVYLHPDDYIERIEHFQALRKEIINKFNQILLKELRKRELSEHHADSWNIYLMSIERITLGGDEYTIKQGKVLVWCSLFDIVASTDTDNKNISLRIGGTNRMIEINIDPNSLANIRSGKANHIYEPWKEPRKEPCVSSAANSSTAPLNMKIKRGELSYKRTDGKIITYAIQTDICQISGKDDPRNDLSIFKIENSKVETKHIEIKYIPTINQFELAAYKPTSINYTEVPLSSGGNLKWIPLPHGAKIILANSVMLNFQQLI